MMKNMQPLKPPTLLETVAGSTASQAGLTAVGAIAGGPLAAVLPVLSTSLAFNRHNERVAAAFEALAHQLALVQEKVESMSESQLKLVGEALGAIYTAADTEKIEYLRRAVLNGLDMVDLKPQAAVFLGRVLRGMSAQEAGFVVKYFTYTLVHVSDQGDDPKTLVVQPGSHDDEIVTGLISLGLLVPASATYDSLGKFQFSPYAAKVIALLQPAT